MLSREGRRKRIETAFTLDDAFDKFHVERIQCVYRVRNL
jgi:hypothetical protein